MNYLDIDIPRISGVRGKLPNYTKARKKLYKKIGNKRVRRGVSRALKTLEPVNVKGITSWDID